MVLYIYKSYINNTKKFLLDKGDEKKRIIRQRLVREKGLLEVCLKIVNKLIPITEKVENAEKLGQKFSSFSEDEQTMIKMANEILQRILQIIFSAIKNDPVYYNIINNKKYSSC